MKIIYLILGFLVLGLTASPYPGFAAELTTPPSSDSSASMSLPKEAGSLEMSMASLETTGVEEREETLADPLEPINRAFFVVNDRLYFWVLKPVARGYKAVFPQDARLGVRNFFSNLTTPIRLVNCLLQAKFKGAGNETVRFLLNSTLGLAGFLDPAKKELKIEKTEADFGQTLGIWGLGPAFYIDWPLLGPSSLRDTVGFAGDLFLDFRTYLFSEPIFYIVRPFELINETSLTIGEYEDLKKAALDPYIAVREAYHEYRQGKIKGK
ncbi:MAG TPA: VacJ family lipoprotein [Thermodesulfobacteriota bacterium]|nr:VacJ family lipoprotein [Thermodesulfobacteriota bacterium]